MPNGAQCGGLSRERRVQWRLRGVSVREWAQGPHAGTFLRPHAIPEVRHNGPGAAWRLEEEGPVTARRNDGSQPRDLAPLAPETRPALIETPIVGEYYGRPQRTLAVARAYRQMLRRQRGVIIAVFLLVFLAGSAFIVTRPHLYRSRAEVIVTPVDRGGGRTDNLAESIGLMTRVRSVATEVRLLSSQDLLDEAFAGLSDDERRKGFDTIDLRMPAYPVLISTPKDTDVVAVEVTAGDPGAAATFANRILETNAKRRQDTVRAIAEETTRQVDTELSRVEKELQSTSTDLARFKQENGVLDVSAQTQAESQALAALQSQANQAESDVERARLTKELYAKELRGTPASLVISAVEQENPIIQSIKAEIERLEQERATLLQEYLPNAPELIAVQNRIEAARKRLASALSDRTVSVTRGRNPVLDSLTQNYINAVTLEKEAGSRLQITRRQAEQVRGRMANLPQSEQKIGMLTSRINELQSTHAYLNGQRQALNLAMYGGLPTVMPIMNARPARFPVSPNIPVSFGLLTVLAGLLALGIAVLRDQLNDHIHTSDMLESLSGRRVLAALPQVRSGVRGLVTSPGCPMPLLEHFRILRGGLMLSALEPLPKIVVLTSPQSSEGKSTVAANLAATVALGDRRTLLIDCDLRHPSLHLIYGLRNTDGLAEILRGGATLESCLRPSGVPNLDVITAGTATGNPPELLGGAALPALLATVAEDYDTVFLDATPLVNLSDAAILARLADGVLLVVASDRTRQPELQQALRTLEQTGANVLGLVYNRDPDAKALSWQ